jgi:tetratricopeptide (TPR) repeat protein
MKANNFINENDPSHIIVEQIMEMSEYRSNLWEATLELKRKLDETRDKKILLKLNDEMQTHIMRMSKLKEYTGYLIETFRTVPLRSERLQQAEMYFYQGKYPEMDEALDAGKIRAEIERLEEDRYSKDEDRREKVRTLLEYRSYELVVKALYGYTFIDNPKWHESVYHLLKDAYDASFNMHSRYELASYLMLTDEQEWAFEVMDDAYIIARDTEGEAARQYEAKSLWALGVMARKKKDYPKAVEYAGKALKIYTELTEKNPAEYRPKMSDMLVIVGDYHTYMKNYPVALVVFEEAMKIRRELALHGSFEYAMNLADVTDKLGSIHLCMEEYPEAISHYEEALRIKEDNIDNNLYQVLESKANTLYNLTVAHFSMHEYEKAVRRANEELEARKEVQEIDPFGQLPYRAKTGSILADLYLHLNRPEDAVRERERVVKLYRALAEHSREDDWLNSLGEALNHCSNLYFRMKSYGKYILTTKEAVKIFRRLAIADPKEYLLTVGCLLGNICHFYEQISPDRKKALEAATEACRILSTLERDETVEFMYNKMKEMIGRSV